MKVSIIGSGFVAENHIKSIRALGHEVSTIISRTEENAALFADKWGVPIYGTDIALAIDNSDCLHICTPPGVHYPQAKQAILAGKHVICEKPLVFKPAEAKELYHLSLKQEVVAAVNFNVRYHEACARAKTAIANPEFGPIRMIHGSYLQEFHAAIDYYGWRYQEGNTRATTEIGSHWIDLVRYWTGLEIHSVAANFANFSPNRYLTADGLMHPTQQEHSTPITVHSEDAATIFLKFSNGAIGNVVLSEVAHGRKNELILEVTGQHQSVWWNNEHPYQLKVGKKGAGTQILDQPFGDGFPNTFTNLFSAVYQAIEQKTIPNNFTFPTFEDGYKNALICQAIYESAVNNSNWVRIND